MTAVHYVGTTSHFAEPTIRLAAKLAELAPGRLSRATFTSGGSESVESALKLAKQYQRESGRKPRAYKTISRWTAYHGSTMGALSVTDWLAVREVFEPRVPGHSFIPNPTRYRNPFGMDDESYADFCATYLERQIELEGPETVSAFIGEPIMQAHGVQMPPKHYWDRVRAICDKYQVVLIVDEVITGFGRTGAWFASEHFGLEPDIMTMAKALSAGYAPIGAVITRDEIADAIPLFRHVHTFAGHASAAAAANAAIAIKERDGLIERARQNGEQFGKDLAAALEKHPIVGQVRGHRPLALRRLHRRQEDQGEVHRRHRAGDRQPHARPRGDRQRHRHGARDGAAAGRHHGRARPGGRGLRAFGPRDRPRAWAGMSPEAIRPEVDSEAALEAGRLLFARPWRFLRGASSVASLPPRTVSRSPSRAAPMSASRR